MTKWRPEFVKLPVHWINEGKLTAFQWKQSGSDETAALMLFAVIAHHMDPKTGMTKLTYDQLCYAASLSRAKVAGGLAILEGRDLVKSEPTQRSVYQVVGYNPLAGWAKLPVRNHYVGDKFQPFADFTLRTPAELDALKMYFLFSARRDNDTNMASISYDKIVLSAGVDRKCIRKALSILIVKELIHIERFSSDKFAGGIGHAYRLTHIDNRKHMGTVGKDTDLELKLIDSYVAAD